MKLLEYQIHVSDNGSVKAELRESFKITPSETTYLDITPLDLLLKDYIPLILSDYTQHNRERLERIGTLLYQVLFPSTIAGHFLELVWRKIVQAPDQYHLALSISFDSRFRADVVSLPWELLYLPRGKTFLSTDPRVSFFRRTSDWVQIEDITRSPEKHSVLLVRLQPHELESVALYPIKNFLEDLSVETGKVKPPEILENPSPQEIEETLKAFRPSIIHFLMHGRFNDRSTHFGLIDNSGREVRWYGDQSFSDLFHVYRPELLILQACEGGRLSDVFSFSNGAALLVKNHLPAVIAMQFPITNKSGWVFSRRMYKDLIQGETIDRAVQNGRRSLALSNEKSADDHSLRDFATPVLWIRTESQLLKDSGKINNEFPGDIERNVVITTEQNLVALESSVKQNTWSRAFVEELISQIHSFYRFKKDDALGKNSVLAEIVSIALGAISKNYSEQTAMRLATLIIDADLRNIDRALSSIQSNLDADDSVNYTLSKFILDDVKVYTIQDFTNKLSKLLDSIEIQKGCFLVVQSTHVLSYCLEYFVESRRRDQIIQCLNEFAKYPKFVDKNIIQLYKTELGNNPSAIQINRISNKISNLHQQENAPQNYLIDYLVSVQSKYLQWKDSYVSLEGALQDTRPFKLRPGFIDTEFQQIISDKSLYPYPQKTIPIPDILKAMIDVGSCILLGEPGAGKTTTLWKLAIDMVEKAIEDITLGNHPKIPILIPLGGFLGFDDTFLALIERHSGLLSDQVSDLLSKGQVTLLLDGLNEIPIATSAQRIQEISDFLSATKNDVIVTCRLLDYQHDLALTEIKILPLNPLQINNFCKVALQDYPIQADELFWNIAGSRCEEYWRRYEEAGGEWDSFWLAKEIPSYIDNTVWRDYGVWKEWLRYRDNLPSLMILARNPFMLTMMVQIFVRSGGYLPENKATLFETFIVRLLEQQKVRSEQRGELWVDSRLIQKCLGSVAYAMQSESFSGTTIKNMEFADLLKKHLPENVDVDQFIRLIVSANIIAYDSGGIKFVHQLIQEYFVAKELDSVVKNNQAAELFFNAESWWESRGWDEAFVLLTGSSTNPNLVIEWLHEANPILAARCIAEGGSNNIINESMKNLTRESLNSQLHNKLLNKKVRSIVGQALNFVGDDRDGVLSFDWKRDTSEIPGGDFTIGSGTEESTIYVDTFRIARFPVTNAIYKQFVEDGGYFSDRWWIPEGSSYWRNFIKGPAKYPFPFDLDNNSVVGVSWYEAMAFCSWLTNKLQKSLPPNWEIRLPREIEWEKAARGIKNNLYPWGNKYDARKLNATETIGYTMAVGTFKEGVTSTGVFDLSGNVWEWCLSKYMPYPYNQDDGRESLKGGIEKARIVRGGSWYDTKENAMTTARHGNDPNIRFDDWGFRICCGNRLQMI